MEIATNFLKKRSNQTMIKVIAFYLQLAASAEGTLDPRPSSRSMSFALPSSSSNAPNHTLLVFFSLTHTDDTSSFRVSLRVLK